MTKNHMPELADFARLERVLLATSELRASDRVRLAYRPEPEVDRENGIHIATRQDDEGTFERRAKGDLYTEESDTISHKRSSSRAPLDKYRSEGALGRGDSEMNYRLWKAGHMLRQSFRLSKMGGARVTANLLAIGGKGNGQQAITDAAADAHHAYQLAMRDVGVVLGPVIVHVVCMEGTAAEWAEQYGWKNRKKDGMAALRLALDALARHYRI